MGGTRRDFLRRFHAEKAEAFEVDPGPLGWLVDLWEESGQVRVENTAEGLALIGLGWPEIAAWIEGAREDDLAPVYRRGVMQLSAAYAAQAMAARDIGCDAPFDPDRT